MRRRHAQSSMGTCTALAKETRRRYSADSVLFTGYLAQAGIATGDFMYDPEAWRGMTWARACAGIDHSGHLLPDMQDAAVQAMEKALLWAT